MLEDWSPNFVRVLNWLYVLSHFEAPVFIISFTKPCSFSFNKKTFKLNYVSHYLHLSSFAIHIHISDASFCNVCSFGCMYVFICFHTMLRDKHCFINFLCTIEKILGVSTLTLTILSLCVLFSTLIISNIAFRNQNLSFLLPHQVVH